MPQRRSRHHYFRVYTGRLARPVTVEPAKVKPKPSPEAITEAMAEADARLRSGRRRDGGRIGNLLPAAGVCHDCGRKVTGERRFCGPCLAKH